MRIEALEPRRLFSVVTGFAESVFATGLEQPTAMAFSPDGRLFVCQQTGALRVVKDGQLLPDPFLSLTVETDGERGLLGVAFDPSFASNHLVYAYYTTAQGGIHNRISRFVAAGDVVQAGTEQVLVDLPTLSGATNHNGGAIHFGPDGKLYVGVGDNNDSSQSQPLTTPFGKILRLNADGTIPTDNPFVNQTTGQSQAIWASGLRNPYTFAFDSATGAMHINDVGLSTYEEVNVGTAGANYGWPIIEGKRTTTAAPDRYVDPLFAYPHSGGKIIGSAIAGGAFYEPANGAAASFPTGLTSHYFFSDFGAGFVKSIDPQSRKVSDFASGLSGPVDLQEGPDGALYALEYFSGNVRRFNAQSGDLAVEVTTDPASSALQGERGKAKIKVRNVSPVTVSGAVTLKLFASTDDAIELTDVLLTEQTRVLRLKAGRSKSVRLNFTYPATLNGVFHLIGVVQSADAINDGDPANNAKASSGVVTLLPRTVDFSAAFREPTPTLFSATRKSSVVVDVANLGSISYSGHVTLRVRASADNVSSPDDITLFEATPRLRLLPGHTRPVHLKFAALPNLPAGTYFQVVDVDPASAITESDEFNNTGVSATAFSLV